MKYAISYDLTLGFSESMSPHVHGLLRDMDALATVESTYIIKSSLRTAKGVSNEIDRRLRQPLSPGC